MWIRENCLFAVRPATWFSVDELMVPFHGRSQHTTTMPNKPIGEGFKVFALAYRGYIATWLYSTPSSKVEGTTTKPGAKFFQASPLLPVYLSPTGQVPIVLAQQIASIWPRPYILFIDNLFLLVDVAQILLPFQVCCMGTTRKSAAGIPQELEDLYENKFLTWDSTIARQVEHCLCFLW